MWYFYSSRKNIQSKNFFFTENINYSESGPFKTTFPPINYLFEVFLIYADVNRNLGSSLCEICFQIQQTLYATSNEILIRLTICCRPFLKLEPAFRRCSSKEVSWKFHDICNFIKKRLQHIRFPVNIVKFWRTLFYRTPLVAASVWLQLRIWGFKMDQAPGRWKSVARSENCSRLTNPGLICCLRFMLQMLIKLSV